HDNRPHSGACAKQSEILVIELLVRPPPLRTDASLFRENGVHRPSKRRNVLSSVNFFEGSSNERLVRDNETEKPVTILLVATTANPKPKRRIQYGYNPTPIFRVRFTRLKSLVAQTLAEKVSKALTPKLRVN